MFNVFVCVPTFSLYKIAQTMHVKASVSARMSLVRLVQYSLVSSNCIYPFY